MDNLRQAMSAQGRTVGVMADLQGPKIRIGKFAGSKVLLKPGQAFILDADCELGDAERVGLDYPELVDDVAPGDVLLLDDGRIVMDVAARRGSTRSTAASATAANCPTTRASTSRAAASPRRR